MTDLLLEELTRLRRDYADLRDEVQALRATLTDDRNLARRRGVLAAAGTTAEHMLKFMYRREGLEATTGRPAEKRMLDELIAQLRTVLPPHVQVNLRTVQAWRNVGAHDNGDIRHVDEATLQAIGHALNQALAWFFEQYLGELPTEGHSAPSRPARPAAGSSAVLRVAGLETLTTWGWDAERLLHELLRIDYATLDGLDAESAGFATQWAPIFAHHPDTWRMLVDGDRIAGYWHFAPLFETDYDLVARGQLLDQDITIDRCATLELPGTYRIYVCQACLLPEYRSTGNIRMLYASFFDVLAALAEVDVFITHVCANAYTPAGVALCRTFNLAPGPGHSHAGHVHAGTIAQVLDSGFGRRQPQLRALYAREGLLGGNAEARD
jgi:hypothetical protein